MRTGARGAALERRGEGEGERRGEKRRGGGARGTHGHVSAAAPADLHELAQRGEGSTRKHGARGTCRQPTD